MSSNLKVYLSFENFSQAILAKQVNLISKKSIF